MPAKAGGPKAGSPKAGGPRGRAIGANVRRKDAIAKVTGAAKYVDDLKVWGSTYLSDAGFTGPHESVLGRDIHPVVQRFLTNTPQRFTVAKERVLLHGALIDVDDSTGRSRQIQRISEPWTPEPTVQPP